MKITEKELRQKGFDLFTPFLPKRLNLLCLTNTKDGYHKQYVNRTQANNACAKYPGCFVIQPECGVCFYVVKRVSN